MVQRALSLQVCCVCNKRFYKKADLEAHTSTYHGVNWHPAILTRAEDQMEFLPKRPKPSIDKRIGWPVGFGE